MNHLIYNAKFKTKQVLDLNISSVGTPSQGQAFYWVTYENNKLYANYKIYGSNTIHKYQITDPQNADVNAHKKILFTINSDNDDIHWTNNIAYFTHGLNCIPSITIYDNNNNNVTISHHLIDADNISIDFGDYTIQGTWKIIFNYNTAW